MTHDVFFPANPIHVGDTPSADAFGRFRVSNPITIFDNKQLFDETPLIWSTLTASGGSISHDGYRAATDLIATGTLGSKVTRQTFQRFNYQPGRSQLIMMTGVLTDDAADTSCRSRIGYVDDLDGLFFELDGTQLKVVKRTSTSGSAVDIAVNQEDWNMDKLDGYGKSGLVFDVTNTQIFVFDFQWLGVGRVRMGIAVGGEIVFCHEFLHANEIPLVYMSSPNLPLRIEVENTTGSGGRTLTHICSSVTGEGIVDPGGIVRAVDRGLTTFSATNATTVYPLISVRLKTSHARASIVLAGLSIVSPTDAGYRWAVYLNPTVGGTDNASWIGVGDSSLEYDVSRDATNSLTGGVLITSGYVNAGAGEEARVGGGVATILDSQLRLGVGLDGAKDEFVLAIESVTAADTFLASLSYREFL